MSFKLFLININHLLTTIKIIFNQISVLKTNLKLYLRKNYLKNNCLKTTSHTAQYFLLELPLTYF